MPLQIFALFQLFVLVEQELHLVDLVERVLELLLNVVLVLRVLRDVPLRLHSRYQLVVLHQQKLVICQYQDQLRRLRQYLVLLLNVIRQVEGVFQLNLVLQDIMIYFLEVYQDLVLQDPLNIPHVGLLHASLVEVGRPLPEVVLTYQVDDVVVVQG